MKETGDVDSDGNPVDLEDFEKEGDGGVGDEGLEETRLVKLETEADQGKNGVTPGKSRRGKANGSATLKGGVGDVKVEDFGAEPSDELEEEPRAKKGRKKA